MLSVEDIIRTDREAENRRKEIDKKRKTRQRNIKILLFSIVAVLIFTISPQGMGFFASYSQSRLNSPFYRKLHQAAVDTLSVYGYTKETYDYYEKIYKTYDNSSNPQDAAFARHNFKFMADSQYSLAQYNFALYLYQIYINKWLPTGEELDKIQKRIDQILTLPKVGGGVSPPQWVLDLCDVYNIPLR